ncbi:hypothetical protein STAS_17668 [Striga asiatica]|uniref:Uncharacterized protein n=1 Tax=Striga asiatica TaxID=4170 RepID=A0A5A7Q6X3_STRAF|nr:hypothetical protein STAS_17668 [Striga asiatica]
MNGDLCSTESWQLPGVKEGARGFKLSCNSGLGDTVIRTRSLAGKDLHQNWKSCDDGGADEPRRGGLVCGPASRSSNWITVETEGSVGSAMEIDGRRLVLELERRRTCSRRRSRKLVTGNQGLYLWSTPSGECV